MAHQQSLQDIHPVHQLWLHGPTLIKMSGHAHLADHLNHSYILMGCYWSLVHNRVGIQVHYLTSHLSSHIIQFTRFCHVLFVDE